MWYYYPYVLEQGRIMENLVYFEICIEIIIIIVIKGRQCKAERVRYTPYQS